MSKAYSQDLRDRVIDAVVEGMSCRGAAKHYGISASTAVKWLQAVRREQRHQPKGTGGHRPYAFSGDVQEWIIRQIETQPDLTLGSIVCLLKEEYGLVTHKSTLHYFFKRKGISFKKNTVRK